MRKTVQITVAGEPLQVILRPIGLATLVEAGLSEMPSVFASGEGRNDILTGMRLMHGIIVAGTVAVIDSSGRRYRLTMDPLPDPDTLTPGELDPGLSKMENAQILFEEILKISNLWELFRAAGGEDGEDSAVGGDGPGAPQPGETLRD